MSFYAYIHARPDTADASGVFYVGKGMGSRYKALPVRNRHHGFVLAKHGADNILIGRVPCSSEQIAFDLERGLIKCLRRAGVALSNMTDGGEGSSGHTMSEVSRAKISRAAARLAKDPDVQERRKLATARHSQARWSDPEYAERTAKAMRGVPKTRSAASDAARRANGIQSATPEVAAKKSVAMQAKWADPDFRARMLASRAVKRSAQTQSNRKER